MTSPPNSLDTLSHALLECCALAPLSKISLTDLNSNVDLQHTRQQRLSRVSFASGTVVTDTSDPFWTDSAASKHGKAMVIATPRLYYMKQHTA